LPFLRELYAAGREAEMRAAGMDAAQARLFLQFQFDARERYWEQYPAQEDYILLVEDEPAGRLVLRRDPETVYVADIALIPRFQRQGHATGLLRSLIADAARQEQTVSLHVRGDAPDVRRLYERLGFVTVSEMLTDTYMVCPTDGCGRKEK